jgi:hypothetical protein
MEYIISNAYLCQHCNRVASVSGGMVFGVETGMLTDSKYAVASSL